jgi:hypothetical protein
MPAPDPTARRGPRRAARAAGALVAAVALAGLGTASIAGAAGAAGTGPLPPSLTAGHPYRHGVVPTLQWAKSHPAPATSANDLNYGGGIDGVGVTTGKPQIYLVFWGSQWGAAGTNGAGDTTFSGDPDGVAPDLEAFFKGIGAGSETWSGVMTQYCEGVATGSQSCPSGSAQVGYPAGGAFAGLWEDSSGAAPAAATSTQIADEAVAAAEHFGNTTTAANRSVQYDIVSPTGADPDDYETGGFCAWHDYTGDASVGPVSTPWGTPIAFTNMPYVPDVGSSCGENFVNAGSAGTDDGVTIVNGHEYAETITDQYPAGGWTDSSGEETGDKCAWISSGQGAAQDITLTTGSFPVQSTWANDFGGGAGGCEVSHPIVSSDQVTVTNPGSQLSFTGSAVSLQIHATDSAAGEALTYAATGLPAGLSIGSSSGLITGTPTTAATSKVVVTAGDPSGAAGTASFSWVVDHPGVTVTDPGNQSTVTGHAVSLQIHAVDSTTGQTLAYAATGLPAGLSVNASTGLVSGTVTTVGSSSVTVTATDGKGDKGSASFTWAVVAKPACTSKQLLGNPGFETGSAAPWVASSPTLIRASGNGETSHSGNYFALLDGTGTPHTDTLGQTITISGGCHTDSLSYWLKIDDLELTAAAVDTLKVEVVSGSKITVLATYSNLSGNFQYGQESVSLAAFAGKKITIRFVGKETDKAGTTIFALDDTAAKQAP